MTNGDLIVDNNNLTGDDTTTQLAGTSFTFKNLTVRNGADYVIPGTSTLTSEATTGTLTFGGTQRPSLAIKGGATFNPPTATFTFNDIDVFHYGDLGIVTTLSTRNGTYKINTKTALFPANTANRLGTLNVGYLSTFSTTSTDTFWIGALTVQGNGLLTHDENYSSIINKLTVSATTSITVDASGVIGVQNKGYSITSGAPGAGTTQASCNDAPDRKSVV